MSQQRTKNWKNQYDYPPVFPLPLRWSEWGLICGLRWTPATRQVIAALFANDNTPVDAERALGGVYSRFKQVNQVFIRHGSRYRLRAVRSPAARGSSFRVFDGLKLQIWKQQED